MISKSLRFEVFKRDSFTCQYCGRQTPQVILEIDHIIPKSKGGTDHINNLVTSCFDCNRGKGNIPLAVLRITDTRKEEIQKLKEKQEQIRAYEKFLKEQKAKEEQILQDINDHWASLCDDKFLLSENGLSSVRSFLANLTPMEIKEAMSIAAGSVEEIEARFKYFCGVCHNKTAEKSGDTSRKIFKKVQRYFRNQTRGSGYHNEHQLREFCRIYPERILIRAIDMAFSKSRPNYWRAVCEALEEITGDGIDY
jgi:5-methylcytosine-specific restriction endonuclease McrA